MISPDRLEIYKDFIDPEHIGVPYDSRSIQEKLLTVLTPDTKGLVLAAMGNGIYSTCSQLYNRVLDWLDELGLPRTFPLTLVPTWSYIEYREKNGEIHDGSLVEQGAVVKKLEDGFQTTYYSRSEAGATLALPLIQRAIEFVYNARASDTTHKCDSMIQLVGGINTSTTKRRPLVLFDVVEFLVQNPGENSYKDIVTEIKAGKSRTRAVLESLANCGLINTTRPRRDLEGKSPSGFITFEVADEEALKDLDINSLSQRMRLDRPNFRHFGSLRKVISYLQNHPGDRLEHKSLSETVNIHPTIASGLLSFLECMDILKRPEVGWKGVKKASGYSKTDLLQLFYDTVCLPVKEVAESLSPLPLKAWDRKKMAVYMANYQEERRMRGPKGGEETRASLLAILPENGGIIKMSYIIDLYNDSYDEIKSHKGLEHQLEVLMGLGLVERVEYGMYRRITSIET